MIPFTLWHIVVKDAPHLHHPTFLLSLPLPTSAHCSEDSGSAYCKVVPAQLLTQASYCDSGDSRSRGDKSEDAAKNNKSHASVDVSAGGDRKLRWLRHGVTLR